MLGAERVESRESGYGILEPHRSRLRTRDPRTLWQERLTEVFDSQVRGRVFEQQARIFVERLRGHRSERAGTHRAITVELPGREWELDLVVTDEHPDPASRSITAIGEAQTGSRIGRRPLDRLVEARLQLGSRAPEARLLLVGSSFDGGLLVEAADRDDVEIVDLDRLYHGE